MSSTPLPDRTYAKAVGARLRAIRHQHSWSLQDVETLSAGQWKVALLGSYERGDRTISAARLAALADFYKIPAAVLLPDGNEQPPDTPAVLDLDALGRETAGSPTGTTHPALHRLATWARTTATSTRGDHEHGLLPLRAEHGPLLATLAALAGLTPTALVDMLDSHGVLDHSETGAEPEQ